MKKKFIKTSLSINADSYATIQALTNKAPYPNQTVVINQLLIDAIDLREKLNRSENLVQHGILKSLFILRELAKTRGDDFLNQIDNDFSKEVANLKTLLIEEGIDYGT